MTDAQYDELTDEQKRKVTRTEVERIMHVLTMISSGLAIRRAGLIWFLPLCHDSYGENF